MLARVLIAAILLLSVEGARAQARAPADRLYKVAIVLSSVPVADAINPKPEHGAAGRGAILMVEGLRQLGWVDGRNVRLIWRSAEGDAMSTTAGVANIGMVESLGRPERNVTGVSFESPPTINGKRLQLLKRVAPGTKRVAFLTEVIREGQALRFGPATQAAARELGLSIFQVRMDPNHVAQAFQDAVDQKADAILVSDGVKIYWQTVQAEIHRLATRHRLPVIHSVLSGAETGGLMAYGIDIEGNYRRLPHFVDRILRGAKPGNLPIEQPDRLELIVNKGAARAIGLDVPAAVLAQADRVIE